MERHDVVIVGAGHGGSNVAIALRQQGFGGSIVVVGRESELPYERPPLSKEYLARERTFDRLYIRPSQYWVEHGIDFVLSRGIVHVDASRKSVTLTDGSELGYAHLVWAAGGETRRLSCEGADISGIQSIRTKLDAELIMAAIDGGAKRVVIVGGGYIGLEAAAVLRKLGMEVVLVEALDRVLARVAGESLSRFYEQEHRRQGVDLRLNCTVKSIVAAEKGTVKGVHLSDGSLIPADIVIVGIGIVPSVAPLISAGATGGAHGVQVDEYCRTSLDGVYAVGDCAAHFSKFAGSELVRLESVQNATDMAKVAASAICGAAEPYRATPWFWSNQYDLRLQTVGISSGHDEAVIRGEPEERSFSVVYLRRRQVVALDCVNRVRDYVQGKKLVEDRAVIEPEELANNSIDLKQLVDT